MCDSAFKDVTVSKNNSYTIQKMQFYNTYINKVYVVKIP